MKTKSVFPSLLLFGLLMVGLSYFSDLFRQNGQLEIEEVRDGGYQVTKLRKEFQNYSEVVDTALSNHFRIRRETYRTNENRSAFSFKNTPERPVNTPVFDTVIDCYYNNKPLFKARSLKAMASGTFKDPEFWTSAGLEYFEIEMSKSADDVVSCSFAFLNLEDRKLREFTLEIGKDGTTRITEV